jgi:hypothetical protein
MSGGTQRDLRAAGAGLGVVVAAFRSPASAFRSSDECSSEGVFSPLSCFLAQDLLCHPLGEGLAAFEQKRAESHRKRAR